MSRHALALCLIAVGCAHGGAPSTAAVATLPATIPASTGPEVALQLEIFEEGDGNVLSTPRMITGLGTAASVDQDFTLRPVRQTERTFTVEVTPTHASSTECELDVRSGVREDPRLLLVSRPEPITVPAGQWVDVVRSGMVGARLMCQPLGATTTPVVASSE